MDAGQIAYDIAYSVDPELKRRRSFVQSLDTFAEKLKNDTLTFEDLLERIVKCETSYRGMPVKESTVNKCQSIVREAFHDPENAVQLALKVLHALLVSQPKKLYQPNGRYRSDNFNARDSKWKAPTVTASIHDSGNMFSIRFNVIPADVGFQDNTETVRFDKEGWPAPINTQFFDDKYPLITVVEALLSRPDLLKHPQSPFDVKKLADWTAEAVASSCIFSVDSVIHLHTAFLDLSL